MRPLSIPTHILAHLQHKTRLLEKVDKIRAGIENLKKGDPEVSVVIPAYNEEESILQTLSSLSAASTQKSVEIIVVDNNSTDKTAELVGRCGARCISER